MALGEFMKAFRRWFCNHQYHGVLMYSLYADATKMQDQCIKCGKWGRISLPVVPR